MTALAALCFSLTAQAQGPVVVSDKDDYSPGETALFQATGFQSGELLDFSVAVADEDGTWIPDIAWADVPADGSGNAEVDYVVPETWANKSLQLTVMGLSSGLMATTTFTDQSWHNVNFSTTGLPNGLSINISGVKVRPGNLSGTPQPFGPDPFTTPGSSVPDEQTSPNTLLQFGGFPPTVPGMGEHWTLTSFSLIPGSAPGTLLDGDLSTGAGAYQTGAFNNFGGQATTILANYTHHFDVTNHPPVITYLSPTVDLGAVVGCLGTGSGFGQIFPISWAVVSGTGNEKIVQATFTLPDSSTLGPYDVANVTDADAGDTISVTLANQTTSVTINGPGSGSASFSVDISANDGHVMVGPTNCVGTASARIGYAFHGFFSPLSNIATTKVKQGATVPVKFQLADCSGTLITDMNMPGDGSAPLVDVDFVSGAVPAGDPIVTDAGNSNGDTDFARWDPTGMQWIFNLKTNSTYTVGDTYGIQVLPNDGSTHQPSISIK
jgi:hypothetical protein